MKFTISQLYSDPLFNGSNRIFGTGQSPFICFTEELYSEPIDENVLYYKTGINEEDIHSNNDLSHAEKESFLKELKTVKEKIKKRFSEKALSNTNKNFWKSRNSVTITSNTFSEIYDTENIEHLILLWQIRGGGFSSIAHNQDTAVQRGKQFYISTVEEKTARATDEKFGDKRKAFAKLTELLDKGNKDGLVWITWTLSPDTDQLKGFGKNTTNQTYENILTEYIEGTYSKAQYGKKQCAENFTKAFDAYKATPDTFITNAMMIAAYHHGILGYANTRYYYSDGNLEFSSLENAAEVLMLPVNVEKFKDLSASLDKRLLK